jgi:hypothetical protein
MWHHTARLNYRPKIRLYTDASDPAETSQDAVQHIAYPSIDLHSEVAVVQNEVGFQIETQVKRIPQQLW